MGTFRSPFRSPFRPLTRAITDAGLGGFNPISLFAENEPGYIYDNNDLSGFYSDSAMTTQAVVNGPVGAQLDKSPNAKHRTQATAASRPTLRGTPTGANLFTNYGTPGAGWVNSGGGVATATAVGVGVGIPAGITPASGRTYRIRYTTTVSAGSVRILIGGAGGATRTASGTYEEYLTTISTAGAQFAAVTTFTGTVSAVDVRDVTADVVTAPYGLQYDGVDDFMLTASVNFTATDAVNVCMGVRKFSDASAGALMELSVNGAANNGALYLHAPTTPGSSFTCASRGTALALSTYTDASVAAPITVVQTGLFDISTDTSILRINGIARASSATDQGTGNYGNHAFYFGRRGGSSLPFNGLDYGGVCIGRTLSAADLTSVERWTGQRTGVTL